MSSLASQIRKGIAEGAALAALASCDEMYALQLGKVLRQHGGIIGGEGTLYPLLARMHKQGWVADSWQPGSGGPPRRCYRITAAGRQALAEFEEFWNPLVSGVDLLLKSNATNATHEKH